MNLSVIIPTYNEAKTILKTLKATLKEDILEIIVVDDGSTDKTIELLKKVKSHKVKVITHPKNMGKGAAIRSGLKLVSGDYLIIQDADLEYHPKHFSILSKSATEKVAIYGSRLKNHGENKSAYFKTYLGNLLVTSFFNLLYQKNLSDSYTCYKLLPTKIAKKLKLTSNGFEIEAEITAKLAKKGIEIIEIPIKYTPRKYEDGKKIKAKDALKGLYTYIRLRP